MALNTVQLQPRHMLNLSLLVGCTLSIIVGILFFLTACIFPDDISCAVPDFAFVLLLSIIWVGIPSAVATWTVSAVASTTLSVPIVPKLLLATLMSSFVGIIIVLALRHALTSPQTLLVSALTGGAVAGTIQGLFLHRTTLSIPVGLTQLRACGPMWLAQSLVRVLRVQPKIVG